MFLFTSGMVRPHTDTNCKEIQGTHRIFKQTDVMVGETCSTIWQRRGMSTVSPRERVVCNIGFDIKCMPYKHSDYAERTSSLPQHQQRGLTSSLSVSRSIKPSLINQTHILNTTKITYDRVLSISWASCCFILSDKAQHSEKCPTGILKYVQNTLWFSFNSSFRM